MKIKERDKINKYLDLAGEMKKLCNMKATVIAIGVGALGIVSKSLEKRPVEMEIRRRIKTIQTTALLKSARMLRRVLET